MSPVSRTRRACFAFCVVAFSMAMMVIMGFSGHADSAASTALAGFRDIALFVAMTYIGGSTVDYSSTMLGQRLGMSRVATSPPPDGDGKISD